MEAPPRPMVDQDAEHLKLLSIFHYILAGLTGLGALVPVIHLVIGMVMIVAPAAMNHGHGGPPVFIGFLFVIIALVIITLGLTMAVLLFLTARNLAHRRNYTFCFVIACIQCVMVPLGTVLGVFTLIVLSRPSVKGAFSRSTRQIQLRPACF